MPLKPGCQQIAKETAYLYVQTHDLMEVLLRLERPPESLLENLQRSVAPILHLSPGVVISEEERHPLGNSLAKVIGQLPKGDLDKLTGNERFEQFKPAIDEADRLLSQVEDLMFTKVVACEKA